MEYGCENIDSLENVTRDILAGLGDIRLVLLHGDLGSGKTTFVKACCSILDSSDEVTSPTFSLVNVYQLASGDMCAHIDLYRLDSTDEVVQAGIEEYLGGEHWCFVEWPELAYPLIESAFAEIFIEITEESHRKFRILKRPATV